ncbi:hypothetical protein OJAV_G00219530 [Oryzias javanicus]|uniref:Uncharacterized protein n=1 Tax=Oryzias javanicus TaxID=123683 RepID=A0A3S2LL89_ORYJA|nr:hypothetical protein OJAV_G00219530 [Oryzias javanicus]
MSSSDSLKNGIRRLLSPAADDISGFCFDAFSKYEEELRRQRALLDLALKPQAEQPELLLPEYHLTDQDRNPNGTAVKAEAPESPEPK